MKYPQMDLCRVHQCEHVSNILVAKYADKSEYVSIHFLCSLPFIKLTCP